MGMMNGWPTTSQASKDETVAILLFLFRRFLLYCSDITLCISDSKKEEDEAALLKQAENNARLKVQTTETCQHIHHRRYRLQEIGSKMKF